MKKLQYIKVVLKCGLVILFYHIFFMCKFARHPEKYPLEYRYQKVRKEIRFVLKAFHVNYNVQGMEKFNNLKEKSLIISNHLSDADPLVLIACSEKPITFVSKIETFKFSFVGKICKAIEVFPLDRKNLMNQIGQIKDIVTYLKDPSKPSVIIYIEGTRNKNPENPCLDFHPGTLKIALMANCPILSVATFGTFRILDGRCYLKSYPTSFSFIEVLSQDEMKKFTTVELAANLKDSIDNEVNKLRKYDKDYILNSKNSKKRKELETRVDACINS